jgi:hypothetical protein
MEISFRPRVARPVFAQYCTASQPILIQLTDDKIAVQDPFLRG